MLQMDGRNYQLRFGIQQIVLQENEKEYFFKLSGCTYTINQLVSKESVNKIGYGKRKKKRSHDADQSL
ncbi:MAG: hypothetical protein ICV65_03150 [Flavisolibacter sp.]|nr:hypothetical protein [Flavisolibacter sp.]MBD0350132.1 hypothetical protein [Flavisolibacter sp.]